ncbi:hypothetical protein [Opacimonas viscosa]|uniref:Uncharacterized protein n=1 Tax=Opacimonas viscosa TaxID=2961944 RepID=A0AA42BPK1_9ALTE|nr:hypothetical protein [Opacimonas viscosa]MCP3428516.1 hypothetical protein [Opacimonas viscosa]
MPIKDYLQEGVFLHPFSDQSGCTLFNDRSTQMLTLFFSESELLNILTQFYCDPTKLPDDRRSICFALLRQDFIHPTKVAA